jgi:hypothetical protein
MHEHKFLGILKAINIAIGPSIDVTFGKQDVNEISLLDDKVALIRR